MTSEQKERFIGGLEDGHWIPVSDASRAEGYIRFVGSRPSPVKEPCMPILESEEYRYIRIATGKQTIGFWVHQTLSDYQAIRRLVGCYVAPSEDEIAQMVLDVGGEIARQVHHHEIRDRTHG